MKQAYTSIYREILEINLTTKPHISANYHYLRGRSAYPTMLTMLTHLFIDY
jgi:hypothetical protein